MWQTIKADLAAAVDGGRLRGITYWAKLLGKVVLAPQVQAVILFRVGSRLAGGPLRPLAFVLRSISVAVAGAEIHPDAQIGPGLALVHSVGVVVGGSVRIGANCRMSHGVTLGEPGRGGKAENWGVPVVGSNVTLGAHAVVVGPLHVGDGAVIGANSVVTRDVPAGMVAVGSPACVVGPVAEDENVDFEAALLRHRRDLG